MTPKKLALAGLVVIAAWTVVILIGWALSIDFPETFVNVVGNAAWIVGGLLLLGAGLAKVIEVGVRSGRQD